MAATIATAYGIDRNRQKEAHRLGSVASSARVATWHTSADVIIYADGRGRLAVTRDGETVIEFEFGPEDGSGIDRVVWVNREALGE